MSLLLGDTGIAIAAFLGMTQVWHTNLKPPFMVVFPIALCLIATALAGGYRQREDFLSLRFAVEHLLGQIGGAMVATAAVGLLLTYGSNIQPSRGLLLCWPMVFYAGSLIMRRGRASYERRARGKPVIALVGTETDLSRLRAELQQQHWHGRSVVFDPAEFVDPAAAARALESFNGRLSSVVLGPGLSSLSGHQFSALISTHLGWAPVYTWEGFFEVHLKKVCLESLTPDWIFQGSFRLGTRSFHQTVKRAFDLLAALTLGLLAAPIMLATALCVRLCSPGPVLFIQDRRGRYGQTFRLVKFRTMTHGNTGGTTTAGDQRITPCGHFLRRYRLDELPQLWNVLRGDMSLIGPRPEWTICADEYTRRIDLYDLRHLVRPGLTGWAQVNYPYGQDVHDARAKLSYDLFYIRNFSLVLDFVIIVKTGYVMLFGRGGR